MWCEHMNLVLISYIFWTRSKRDISSTINKVFPHIFTVHVGYDSHMQIIFCRRKALTLIPPDFVLFIEYLYAFFAFFFMLIETSIL